MINKVGFHVAANCHGCGGIEDYWRALDSAGIPFTVYAADDSGLILMAEKYTKATLIYRDTIASNVNPTDYARDPQVMASIYWDNTLSRLPDAIKELRGRVWIELLNEPGGEPNQARWVGALMGWMARIALQEGYRVCGPGWAAGNPEPDAWETAEWRDYLELCAQYPAAVAVSVHEYSLDNDIHHMEPWLIGRFIQLLDACKKMNIKSPTIFITECGWTLNSMPPDEQAKKDIDFLAHLYNDYPEVVCAALWTLQGGKGNGNLPQRLNALMPWLTNYTLQTYDPEPDNPPMPTKHKAIIVKMPQNATTDQAQDAISYIHSKRRTLTYSHDDMENLLLAGTPESYVELVAPSQQPEMIPFIEGLGYKWVPLFAADPFPTLGRPFAYRYVTTSPFNAPRDYSSLGGSANDRHEGIDLDIVGGNVNNQTPILAMEAGVVDISKDGTTGYGKQVRIMHVIGGKTFYTRYCHLDARFVQVGARVQRGQPIGEIGSTGNSTGEHLHLNIELPPGKGLSGYVVPDVIDPTPHVPSGIELPLYQPGTRTLDILPYLRGNHRAMFDMGYASGTQNVQVQHWSETTWVYSKGENGEYERLGVESWLGEPWIFRYEDTSESPTRFYAHYRSYGTARVIGAPWLPRYVIPGTSYTTQKYVQHFLKNGCVKQNGGGVTDDLRVTGWPHEVTYPQSLATLSDVITVEWAGGEQYDFAHGLGCVAFRDQTRSFWYIGQVYGRADKLPVRLACLPPTI